jgi:hypothetical protein
MKSESVTSPWPARASWRRVSPLDALSVALIGYPSPPDQRRGQVLRLSGAVNPSSECFASASTWDC